MAPELAEVDTAISQATEYALKIIQPDGHWYGEMQSNSTITAEYVFLKTALGLEISPKDRADLSKWLLADQNQDGSYSLGYGLPGDISTTAEAYLALKILGVSASSKPMKKSQVFVLGAGGLAKVRIFTRIFFAMLGLWPWDAVPQLPPEFILLPSCLSICVYRLASWARMTLVPLLVIAHYQPVYAIPEVTDAESFLDELWVNPGQKKVPYSKGVVELWHLFGLLSWEMFFVLADKLLYLMRHVMRMSPLRAHALSRCMEWTLEREETTGDWAGIFPPMINSLIALQCEGYTVNDDLVKRGLNAVERFAWRDEKGMRMQPCVSPVWDTILMTIGLCDAEALECKHVAKTAMSWVQKRQILDPKKGDWREYRPQVRPGGWAFEYSNTWYPDIDDTAAAVIAFVKQDPESCNSAHVIAALEWILGMQNPDGGWAAFDVENDKLFLNKIPFSDMEALCDPSTADVTGRVLEAFGIVLSQEKNELSPTLLTHLETAANRAISFLRSIQEPSGSWWGRWGANYVYGTSNVLCALAHNDTSRTRDIIEPAIKWLKCHQHTDGGWGEGLQTYTCGEEMVGGESTPSQTAWALMGLLAHIPATDDSIKRGVSFLLHTQVSEDTCGSWYEPQYTGTGFPGHFYLHYDLYRHYFPLMALGRYRKAIKCESN